MPEMVPRVKGEEIDLPPVVSSLIRLFGVHNENPAAQIELQDGHKVASSREVLEYYGFNPDNERSKTIAYATRLLASAQAFGGRAVRALDETMFYQSTGLYEERELVDAATEVMFPDMLEEAESADRYSEFLNKFLARMEMGRAMVGLGDFLLSYAQETQWMEAIPVNDPR